MESSQGICPAGDSSPGGAPSTQEKSTIPVNVCTEEKTLKPESLSKFSELDFGCLEITSRLGCGNPEAVNPKDSTSGCSAESAGECSAANPFESDLSSAIGDRELECIENGIYDDNLLEATPSSQSTPSRKRPVDFLPMNAEIKRIGIEISEEHAKQLKNDVRRLSPVLVSLRERTLGEISLTSDSGLFEDNDPPIRLEKLSEENLAKDPISNDEQLEKITNSALEEREVAPSVDENPEKSQDVTESRTSEPAIINPEGTRSSDSTSDSSVTPGDRPIVERQLKIVLSRVEEPSHTEVQDREEISDSGKETTIGEVIVTKKDCATGNEEEVKSEAKCDSLNLRGIQKNQPEMVCAKTNLDSLVIDEICMSPKYQDNDQLTRKSPKVVIERISEEASPNIISTSSTDPEIGFPKASLDCVRRTLAESFIKEEEEDVPLNSPIPDHQTTVTASATSYPDNLQESLDETASSDNSELVSIASIPDCVDPTTEACPETDSVVSDEVPTDIILTRLEPERPEAFTEDSAESLALATGARDEVRSDGSDSGLGSEIPGDPGPTPAPESDSETSFLDRIPDDILSDKDKAVNPLEAFVEAGTSGTQQQIPLPKFPIPQKSNLKRRLTDCMEGAPSPKRINTDDPLRKKRSIQFDAVTVYYFPRSQGFTCVPSQGGSTLGMSATHTHAERFSLVEHAAEQRRLHRARLAQLRSERAANCGTEAASSSEEPSDDTDDEPSDTEELDIDSYYFLQPVPTWQRRALLRAAGVRRIDAVEKDDCRDIRASREHCGCGCKGYCDPESCPCSRANVKCQVDRAGFPCGCSRDGCANSSGRIEFNPVRVRTHFIHTLMRLQLEKKQRDEERTEHEMVSDQMGRGPMREVGGIMGTSLSPMEHQTVMSNDPSCLNTGGFTTLHYETHDPNSVSCQPVHAVREDSLDLYAIRDDCYPGEEVDAGQNNQRKLHPEFGQAFQAFPGQQQPVSFPQNAYQDYQGYQTLASTSRTQFQPHFQNVPPANPPFSHYSYNQDSAAIMQQQTTCQSHAPAVPHHGSVYEAAFQQEDPSSNQQQYTNLNSVQPMNAVVQQMGKLEPFSELLAGRYSYYGEPEPQQVATYHNSAGAKIETEKDQMVEAEPVEPANEDCDENFGEIIKKSMVETVSA